MSARPSPDGAREEAIRLLVRCDRLRLVDRLRWIETRAMTTLVTFLEALIVSVAILYATYGLTRLAVYCFRWMVRSIGV